MAWTQADLDKLETAITDGRGARQITFEGQSVTFNSIDEMLKLRSVMKREIDTATANHRFAVTSKGT